MGGGRGLESAGSGAGMNGPWFARLGIFVLFPSYMMRPDHSLQSPTDAVMDFHLGAMRAGTAELVRPRSILNIYIMYIDFGPHGACIVLFVGFWDFLSFPDHDQCLMRWQCRQGHVTRDDRGAHGYGWFAFGPMSEQPRQEAVTRGTERTAIRKACFNRLDMVVCNLTFQSETTTGAGSETWTRVGYLVSGSCATEDAKGLRNGPRGVSRDQCRTIGGHGLRTEDRRANWRPRLAADEGYQSWIRRDADASVENVSWPLDDWAGRRWEMRIRTTISARRLRARRICLETKG